MTRDHRNWNHPLRRAWVQALLAAALLGAASLSGTVGCAGTAPAPVDRAELRPARPHPRAVWVPGRWIWSGRKTGYRWVEGHWTIP